MTQIRHLVRRPRHDQSRHGAHRLGSMATLLAFLLILAACSNDDGGAASAAATDAAADPTPAAEEAGTDEGTDDITADSDDDGVPDVIEDLAGETGSATVTIGDETFEFTLAGTLTVDGTTYIGRCQSLFGMIIGGGYASDGQDITIDLEIPPVDWETYEDERFDAPAIEVEDNVNNASWVADQADEFAPGGGVGEYEQDDLAASGSATFVNQWAPDSEPVEGTFSVDCEA